jgi:hypothetical protein
MDGEAVDCYVDGLVETVDTVDGLFFDELSMCVSKPFSRVGRIGEYLRGSRMAP